jgi:FtsH-binding integral membrane protein
MKSTSTNRNKKSIFKNDLSNLFKLIVNKKEFFLLIFINLIIQIYITYYVINNVDATKQTQRNRNIAYLLTFALILILAFIPMPAWLKFFIFSLFSALLGFILSSIKTIVSEEVIKSAVLGTFSIFVFMFAFGVGLIANGVKLSYQFGLGLFFALLLLIFITIVQYFILASSFLKKAIIVFTLLLFSVFIVYDTNSILQRDYSGDFITASLDYYLDIVNIFTALLADNS